MHADDQYTDDQLDSTLRTLDPADRHVDPLRGRAAEDLEAILAAGTGPATAAPPRRRPLRRLAVAGAAAAALALGIVAIPALSADDDRAFATWAAVPESLEPEQRPEAGEECRRLMSDGPGSHSGDLSSAALVIAEQRGSWTTVVLTGADGFTATCVSQENGMFGTLGNTGLDSSGPRAVQAISLGTGMVHGDDLSVIVGHSGADVTGVTYASEAHGDVVATVSQERFALWMPGDELRDAQRDGVDVGVTYADGTTETVRLAS